MNRRDFLKTVTATTASFIAMSTLGKYSFAEEKKKKKGDGATSGACDPTKGKAKEINYVSDKSHVKDAAVKVEKMGIPFAKQQCTNCVLYKADTKQCMLMTDTVCQVADTGWCTSWAKSPTAKF